MLSILYEDNHLLVINKPAGLLTQPNETHEKSLQEEARLWLKQKYKKAGNVYLEPIHRLDKVTSGIVVFAKTSKALSRLMASMRMRTTKKIYLALVDPAPPQTSGYLRDHIIHGDYRAKISEQEGKETKSAELHYRLVSQTEKGAVLEVELGTGRYHQIRAQLAKIGSPIVGDVKYGSKSQWRHEGIALHHRRFEIPHPITQQMLGFESKPSWI